MADKIPHEWSCLLMNGHCLAMTSISITTCQVRIHDDLAAISCRLYTSVAWLLIHHNLEKIMATIIPKNGGIEDRASTVPLENSRKASSTQKSGRLSEDICGSPH